jgi:nitroreductase
VTKLDLSAEEVLTTTRAVRRRLDLERPVGPAVLEDCLRIGLQAPTAGGRQTWRWLVVRDADKRRALADIYREAAREPFEAALGAATTEMAKKAYSGALHMADILQEVPVLVIPCMLGRIDNAPNKVAAGFYGSIFPAIWNFQLALRMHGLGSTLTTIHLRREAQVAELFGIPADVTQVALLPVAYTKGTEFSHAERTPVDEVAYDSQWGSAFGS